MQLKDNLSGVLTCLFEILVGVLLLVNPAAFTAAIIVIAGILLMITGVINILKYFKTAPEEAAKSQTMTKGLFALVAGCFCTFQSEWFIATFPIITLIYGVVIFLTGLSKVQWTIDALRLKKNKWFLIAISALLSLICGILIIQKPFSSTAALWIFAGVSLIAESALDFAALLFANQEKRAATAEEMQPADTADDTEENL